MNEECIICKAPLEYLDADEMMECALCHKIQSSKTRCTDHHFVCDECHAGAANDLLSLCLRSRSKNPIEIIEAMMALPSCHMHGPEHHIMVGSALLTAYKNAGGNIDLKTALVEMQKRGIQIPGGACGFWGACGAGISAGMFVSIALKATPLAKEAWGLSNQMTSHALDAIGKNGGPRCCKRDSYLAIMEAVRFAQEKLGIEMKLNKPVCSRSHLNNQCLQKQCTFHPNAKKKVAFICVHNSCRSQIAEALGKKLAGDVFDSFSAGTETKPQINQDAVRLMKQVHQIDMEKDQYSKLLCSIPEVDVVVTMGCNVACPSIPCSHREDWGIEDPSGKSDDAFLEVIRLIGEKVLDLRRRLE